MEAINSYSMCFSKNISLVIGATGLLASVYFYGKNRYASIGIGYFALMEILQFFQYVEDCFPQGYYNIDWLNPEMECI